jgi:hypothetical protein
MCHYRPFAPGGPNSSSVKPVAAKNRGGGLSTCCSSASPEHTLFPIKSNFVSQRVSSRKVNDWGLRRLAPRDAGGKELGNKDAPQSGGSAGRQPLGSGHLCVRPPPRGLIRVQAWLEACSRGARDSPIAEPANRSNRSQSRKTAVGRTRTSSRGSSPSIVPAAAGPLGPCSPAGPSASGGHR